MKKFCYSLLILIIISSLLFTGCNNRDLTKGKSPEEIIVESGKAMQSIKTYKIAMNLSMELPEAQDNPITSISMNGEGHINVEPMQAKFDYTMEMGQMKMPMNIYLSKEEDSLVEYISNPMSEGQWMKIKFPLDENMKKMMDPKQSLQIAQDMIKEAKVIGEEKIDQIDHVIIDVVIDPSFINDLMNFSQTNPMSQQMLSQMASALDNLSYKVWIRKDNLYQTKLTIDIGKVMQKMFAGLAPQDIPQQELDTLNKIKGIMTMSFSDFGAKFDFTIPEDVIKNAQDMSSLMQGQLNTKIEG